MTHFQSPIDIVPSKAKADAALRPLEMNYAEDCVKSIANTGNSWKADVDDGKASASIELDKARIMMFTFDFESLFHFQL